METKSMVLSFLALAVLAGLQTTEAEALFVVKTERKAAKGLCLPKRREAVHKVLRQCETRLFTGNNRKPTKKNKEGVSRRRKMKMSDGRAYATANVLYTVDNIGDGRFTAHKDVRLVFGNPGRSSSTSRRTRYDLQLNPGSQNMRGVGRNEYGGTNNRALIAHELGHHVGKQLYKAYFSAVKRRCKLTGYSKQNRREEFAETFAAYITNPSLYKNKGRRCRKAFDFWKEQFGENNIDMTCESRRRSLRGSRGGSGAVSLSPLPIPRPERGLEQKEEITVDFNYLDELSDWGPSVLYTEEGEFLSEEEGVGEVHDHNHEHERSPLRLDSRERM